MKEHELKREGFRKSFENNGVKRQETIKQETKEERTSEKRRREARERRRVREKMKD